jgi:hypothetical protein
MKPGDEFIHYAKAGTTRDSVKEVREKIVYDFSNRVKVMKRIILGTSGQTYDERECMLIVGEISSKFLKLMRNFFSKD